MPLTDPYKIRLGEEILAYLDTLPDAPEYVRAAIRWARTLDLTDASVAELLAARDVVRRVGQAYSDPVHAIDQMVSDVAISIVDELTELEGAGWERSYIAAACDILNGTWLVPFFGAGGMRQELVDGESIASDGPLGAAGGYAAKHGGEPGRFRDLIAALTDPTARALRTVVIEFWRGHRLVERRLGYGPESE